MILAFDTWYFEHKAKTICLSFSSWENEEGYQVDTDILENIPEYKSGEFYKRELPCILSLFKKLKINNVETIIVDGFVFLDDHYKLGLGGHLYRELDSGIPVIGVAKTNFATIEKNKRKLFRGKSMKPLFITAIGIDVDLAKELIKNMSGPNRIPTILKTLDTLTKE